MDELAADVADPVTLDALRILREAGPIPAVCEHGMGIDTCPYAVCRAKLRKQ